MAKRLTRNTRDAYLAGVAAGFADYFDIDPVIARLAFVLLTLLHGAGVILYIICWVVMPTRAVEPPGAAPPPGEAPSQGSPEAPERPEAASQFGAGAAAPTPADRFVEEVRQTGERVVGNLRRSNDPFKGQIVAVAILIGIGLIFLLPRLDLWFWPRWLDLWDLWPLILVVIGAGMLVKAADSRR